MSGCATKIVPPSGRLDTLLSLQAQTKTQTKGQSVGRIREKALRETATSIGARSGLAWRAGRIDDALNRRASYLDKVFDFNAILLRNSVLPPVIVEGDDTLNMASSHELRLSDREYKIVKQAHFVTTAPTWRDYLLMDYEQPEPPDNSLLPKNKAERQLWQAAVQQGWNEGVMQANMIYASNLARLKRDYEGMIRYRALKEQGIVSAPRISKRALGVTGGGEALAVNDRTLTITANPSLNANTQVWEPAVIHQGG